MLKNSASISRNTFPSSTRFSVEHLISRISSIFSNPFLADLDTLIENSLQGILDHLRLDGVSLFQEEFPSSKRFILTNLKIRPGCGPDTKPYLTTDSIPWMMQQFLVGKETQYSRLEDLPEEASIDKQTLRGFGHDYSGLAIPLFNGDRVYGALGIGVAREIIWDNDLVDGTRVVAQFLSAALLRKQTEQKIQKSLEKSQEPKSIADGENVYFRQEQHNDHSSDRIVFHTQIMADVLEQAKQVAQTNATVLLIGETGTGKEMFASAIHEMSSRNKRAMVRVNCGAIPAALVESEMFGREKGAYTGALSRQIGRFEMADGSTIFLDEITDLPMEVQVKLLRVLQERQIERLGNPKPIHVDVRVIAATNQSLQKAVEEGKFREDLFYRLNVFPIEVPPLRERKQDIPMLVWAFVDELAEEFGKRVESISQRSMDALLEYTWPGNVRELRNTIERAMIVCNSPVLEFETPGSHSHLRSDVTTVLSMRETEIQHIRRVLGSVAWKIRGKNGAAEILGMKPTTLETRMAKLGISRPNRTS